MKVWCHAPVVTTLLLSSLSWLISSLFQREQVEKSQTTLHYHSTLVPLTHSGKNIVFQKAHWLETVYKPLILRFSYVWSEEKTRSTINMNMVHLNSTPGQWTFRIVQAQRISTLRWYKRTRFPWTNGPGGLTGSCWFPTLTHSYLGSPRCQTWVHHDAPCGWQSIEGDRPCQQRGFPSQVKQDILLETQDI